jgi:hypothetical protein
MAAPQAPTAELADLKASQARSDYPQLWFGGPVFWVAREREQGGWELHRSFAELAPQGARDNMRAHFHRLAQAARRSSDRAEQTEYMQAAERMDWEAIDEMTVLGARYRVVRADTFIRSGPAGPEPPRPTDPDPGEPGRAHELADRAAGAVIDPVNATSMSEGILKLELLEAVYEEGSVPPEVRADSIAAALTHTGGALLPPAYTTVELAGGHWKHVKPGTDATPQGVRDRLAFYLRVIAPCQLGLNSEQRAMYAVRADQLDNGRGNELEVAGRRFRVARVERLVRIGTDGPEGPRPSDYDPQLPARAEERRLREQGALNGGSEDENKRIEPNKDTQRLARLVRDEQQRRRAQMAIQQSADPRDV